MGPTSRGYKHVAQTRPEEQGPLKLTTLAPQVSYSKPKRPNYNAKTVQFQSCGSAVVRGCRTMNRSLWRVANQALSTVLAPETKFLTKHILRTHKPPRVGSKIKLHKIINKLIKKDHYVWERSNLEQLTKMQPMVNIKDIKWLGKSL